MIYPNWLYYPDGDLELFIDTVQQTSYVASTDHQEYIGAIDGRSRIKATPNLPTATFECTWDTNHIKDIYRYLEYLLGKEVILAFGPQELASYAKIVEASVPWTIGTVQKASLSVQFLGAVRGQFREAEDVAFSGGTSEYSDSLASSGKGRSASHASGYVAISKIELTQSDVVLPLGDYTLFFRAKGATTSSRLRSTVWNSTDENYVASGSSEYLTTSYKIYTRDISIESDDIGDTIQIEGFAYSSDTVYLDFLGFVAKP
jgi:hypothetical protein